MANGMRMVLLCVLNESQNDAQQKFLFLGLRHFPLLILLIKYLQCSNKFSVGVKTKN